MDGAASEAVRGLKAEKDSHMALIWEALSRRFGFIDEPERAMRHFDVRKQLEGETLAVFEHSLRMLHREAWPKTDIKSPEADSLLRRKFVDGIVDLELQKYLRLHAASDDFATTVSKGETVRGRQRVVAHYKEDSPPHHIAQRQLPDDHRRSDGGPGAA